MYYLGKLIFGDEVAEATQSIKYPLNLKVNNRIKKLNLEMNRRKINIKVIRKKDNG
jgi:hypothetical protein